MICIHAKIGTWPAGNYKVLRKRKKPVVGDKLVLRGFASFDWEDYAVRVVEIKNIENSGALYVVERW